MKPKTAAQVRAMIQNRATERPRSELPAVSIDGATATIRLFDAIDSWGEWWGLSAKEFAATIDALPPSVTTIELLINSPGGEVYDGVAIVNMMRAHRARIVAVVQGIAASAASFIACAADETIMAPNSTLMIHNAWGMCVGNADEMVTYAALLEKLDGDMATIYTTKSAKPVEEVRGWMSAETFFTAEEAVAAGLADSVSATSTTNDDTSPAEARWSPTDLATLAAALTELGHTIPSAGEREEQTIEPATRPASVDPEQASRLLATLTLNQGENHNE